VLGFGFVLLFLYTIDEFLGFLGLVTAPIWLKMFKAV